MNSSLQELLYNTTGWSAIVNTNFEYLDDKLQNILNAGNIPGTQSIINSSEIGGELTPTSASPTISNVSGTGDDTTINTNFTNIETSISDIITDLGSASTGIEDNKTAIENIQTKLNSLLSALRLTSGCGILAD